MIFDINIISMNHSSRRARFNDFPYPFVFFDAYTTPTTFNLDKANEYYQRDIKKGEVGCTTSHYELYRDLLSNSDKSWHLILEDDAKLEIEAFKDFVLNFNPSTTKPTIFILGHSKTSKKLQWVQKLKQPMKSMYKFGQHSFGQKHISFVGTVSYMINNEAIKAILSHIPFWLADDWEILESLGIDVLHINENIVYEELDGISTTDNLLIIQHNIYKNPIKTIAKIILNRYFYLIGSKKRFY